jgi:hypothetical protein
MFSFFFNRKPIVFEIQIDLSKISSVQILKKADKVSDKEFILLGLLTYARLLRLFRLKKIDPKYAPYTFFIEAQKTRPNFQNDSDFLKKVSDTIAVMKNTYDNPTSLKITCRGDSESDKIIYSGIPKSTELGCYVYTIYSFVQSHISEQNTMALFQLFVGLSKLKISKEITANDAINFPNFSIKEIRIS